MKTFKINGKDFTRYFIKDNMSVEYSLIKGSNAGTMLDGSYTDDEIAIKAVITLKCRPLDESQAVDLFKELLSTVYPLIEYFDLRTGDYREIECLRQISASDYWGGLVGGNYWGNTVITLTER